MLQPPNKLLIQTTRTHVVMTTGSISNTEEKRKQAEFVEIRCVAYNELINKLQYLGKTLKVIKLKETRNLTKQYR